MTIFCLALDSHGRAGFALADHERTRVLAALAASPDVDEAALLVTCHRVELYLAGGSAALPAAQPLLAPQTGWHTRRDAEAALHLLRVACGLESVVLGEPQILGQVTTAYQQAQAARSAGPVLAALFQTAIRCGKAAHSETAISRGNVSIASVALGLARRHVGDLAAARVAIAGAGEQAALVAHHAAKLRVANLRILNRAPARAAALAAQVHGVPAGLDELPAMLAWADVLICAVGCVEPLITDDLLRQAGRPTRPLALIDLSAPAAVAVTPERWPDVAVFGLDEIMHRAGRGTAQRQSAVPQVEAVIRREYDALQAWLAGRSAVPTVTALRRKAQRLADDEVGRTLRLLGDVNPATAAAIDELARRLANKLLHEPTVRVQASAAAPDGPAYTAALRYLFALSEEEACLV